MWRKQLRQTSNPLFFLSTRRFKRRAFDDDHNVKDKKVFFIGEDDEEYLWCLPNEEFYTVSRIPFVNKEISLGDKIKVVRNELDNKLYFERIEKMSDNSTIKIYLRQRKYLSVTDELNKLKCKFMVIPPQGIICVNVPKDVDYSIVKNLLLQGEREEKCDLEFLCLRGKRDTNSNK